MNILIASRFKPNGKRPIGGVQSWCLTVGNELSRLGHEVTYREAGEADGDRYDAGIFANACDTGYLRENVGRSILFSHGIIAPEAPMEGFDAYAATSEEVGNKWGINTIIRQPIDLDFWSEGTEMRAGVIRYSYRPYMPDMHRAAMRINMACRQISASSHLDARAAMQSAALVVASGRALLEAAACGAPVLLADNRTAYMRPMMMFCMGNAMLTNYSGRGGIAPSRRALTELMREAIKRGSMRAHVQVFHDVRNIVPQIINALEGKE